MGRAAILLFPRCSFSYVGAGGIPATMAGGKRYRRAFSLGSLIPRRRRVTRTSRASRHGQKRSALGHTYPDYDGARSTILPAPAATEARYPAAAEWPTAEATAASSPKQAEDRSSSPPLDEWWSEDDTRHSRNGAARREITLSRFQQRHLCHQGTVLRQRPSQVRQSLSQRQTLRNVLSWGTQLSKSLMVLR